MIGTKRGSDCMKSVIRPFLFLGFAFLIVYLMQLRIDEMEQYNEQLHTFDESSVIYVDIEEEVDEMHEDIDEGLPEESVEAGEGVVSEE